MDESQEKKEAPTIMEQMGGVSGLISSTLPILILIPVNARWGLMPALMAAMGVACGVFLWRIIRRENLQPAFSGLIGVGIGAAIAWFTGDAKGFFLYGIWMSLLYAAIFFISVIIRWPAVGVVWKGINGDGMSWRTNKKARYTYDIATIGWGLVFLVRFLIQKFFYDADATNSLAVAKILTGWPLTGIMMLVSVWAVRRANVAIKQADGEEPTPRPQESKDMNE